MKQVDNKQQNTVLTSPGKEVTNNPWKISFLILLGLLIGAFIFLSIQVSSNREKEYVSQQAQSAVKEPSFSVQLKKEQVNELISYYLNDFLSDSGVKYKFYLEDKALLNGTFDILGYDMQFYLYFDPYVMENGDVQLKAKELSLGKLPLPISQVMKFAKKKFTVPDWVEINSEEEIVTLHLSDFVMQNKMQIKAEKINLVDDDIRFNVYIPTEEREE